MRILVLILQFPPDVNTSGVLMAQLCEGLMARGHHVSVITTFPHYAQFRVADEFRGKLMERRSFRGMDVIRLFVLAPGRKENMINRLLSYLSFNVLATVAGVLLHDHYDVILCSNGSFFSGISASLIGAAKRIPFIYNVQDLYPETPVQAGQLRNPWAIRALEWLERFMYARATHLSVISTAFRNNIVAKGVTPDKISTIPNFVDTDFIRPLPKDNAFSQLHALSDKFVVTHAGNLGYVYDLDTFVEAASLLRSETRIHFVMVGDGVVRPQLEAQVRALGLTNLTFLPFQPRERLPLLRAASDTSTVTSGIWSRTPGAASASSHTIPRGWRPRSCGCTAILRSGCVWADGVAGQRSATIRGCRSWPSTTSSSAQFKRRRTCHGVDVTHYAGHRHAARIRGARPAD